MAKKWWFPFDYRVWRTDSNLRRCSLETRGFWVEALCAMYESGDYQLTGSYEELGWLIGCSPEIVARCTVELKRTCTANVTLGNGTVTLLSRKLKRDLSAKELNTLRVQKYRRNADVTVHSKSNSNSNNKKEEIREEDAPQTVPKPATKKGSRIPATFLLTSEMRTWAALKKPDVDLSLETEKFVNYWRSATGRNATKLDWSATWRVWILNSKGERNGTNKSNGYGTKRTDAEVFEQSADFYANYPEQHPA